MAGLTERRQILPLPLREGVGGGAPHIECADRVQLTPPPDRLPQGEGEACSRATRWALLLEYDGAPFVGWQRQDNGLSVQAVLETAAARLNHGNPVISIVAGRTDAGVHAEGQVAQLELPDTIPARKVRDALNFHMKPHPVVVLRAAPAPEGWNARFSATRRTYRYRILNRRARPALLAGRVWHVAGDTRRRRDARSRTDPARPARFHVISRRRLPGEEPAAHARPAGGSA